MVVIVEDSLKWSMAIRTHYPTLLFFFLQSYRSNAVVIVYMDTDNTIKAVYTKLSVDTLATVQEVPQDMCDRFFKLIPDVLENTFRLPGLVQDSPWTLTSTHQLVRSDCVLLNLVGVVNESTLEVECIHVVFANRKTRLVETDVHECSDEIKHCVPEFKTIILKNMMGMT